MLDLPPRPKETVPAVIDGPLNAVSFGWQLRPPQDTLVVAVRAVFTIAPDGSLEPSSQPPVPMGDIHYDDDPQASLQHASDLAPYKPRADVTLVGHAHASAGRGGVTRVQLNFGSLRRALAAIGDRAWHKGAPSRPQSYQTIALRWERAFGGAGHNLNPIGLGVGGQRLPNLEDPDSLIQSQSNRPSPVCFAPLPRMWAARAGKLGRYDDSWLANRWPYFPQDFDWGYFNAAPEAQQVPFPRGDESFDLAGVHPTQAVISGKLAGLVARVFVQLNPESGGAFRELPVNLDTIAFDADALELSLVWRGIIDVSAEHAPEIDRLFVCADRLDAPMDAEAIRQRFVAQLIALHGPQVIGAADDTAPSGGDDEGASGDAEQSAADEVVAPPAPVLNRDDALALIASGEALAGLSFAGCDLSAVNLAGRNLAGVLFTDANLDGARFDGADLSGAVLARAQAPRACFKDSRLAGANLSDACLTEADLEGACLDGASLVDVDAVGARFGRASLALAKLTDARLVDACFDHATASQADFSGAYLDGATFRNATLDDAQLYDCNAAGVPFEEASALRMRADGAKLAGCSFERAQVTEASFESADLSDARFGQAQLSRAVFCHAKLDRANLTQVTADDARFRHASLAQAQAIKANLMQANFESADLSGADLRGANLYSVETWKATLTGAKLDQALVAGSKLAK